MLYHSLTLIATIGAALAHMEMRNPAPRRSQYNPFVPTSQIDYDIMAPLAEDGSEFPCMRYQKGPVVQTLQAGTTFNVQMLGSTFHGGGHCQVSISYNDRDFVSLYTVLYGCFISTGLTFPVQLPADLPPCNNCTLAWSWVNAIGNREYYMNCADVRIASSSNARTFAGKEMVVLNQAGYPFVPEFGVSQSDDDGVSFYNNARTITLTNDGAPPATSTSSSSTRTTSTSTSSSSTRTSSTSSTSSSSTRTSSTSTRTTSSSTSSTSTRTSSTSASPSPTSCVDNESYCVDSGRFAQCSNNVFYTQPCPLGTFCTIRSGFAACVSNSESTVPPRPSPTGGSCSSGQSRCKDLSGLEQCSNGIWYFLPCPRGTVCRFADGRGSCVYP